MKTTRDIKYIKDKEVYAMALVAQIMMTHHDQALAKEAFQALRETTHLWPLLNMGAWYVFGPATMSAEDAIESIFAKARERGWSNDATPRK